MDPFSPAVGLIVQSHLIQKLLFLVHSATSKYFFFARGCLFSPEKAVRDVLHVFRLAFKSDFSLDFNCVG